MKRMSKQLYAGIFSLSLGLFLFLGLLMGITVLLQDLVWFREAPGIGVQIIVVLGILSFAQFLIVQMIYTFVIVWKMWSSIQDGHARTTPGKAIGFLFIPIFNIYWIFQVWGGFPADYNNYVNRYKLPIPYLASRLFTAYPVLILLTLIPFLGILASLVSMFVFAGIIYRTCDAVNALVDSVDERRTQIANQMSTPNLMVASSVGSI
jgi:hypothetical protein